MTEAVYSISRGTGWTIVILLGILWVALGIYWGRRAKNSEGFMLAGRNVGLSLGSATAMATWVTSNTTMLAPVFALTLGVWGMLAYSTASFGLLLFALFVPRIRTLLPTGVTAGDFFRLRYGRFGWSLFLIITMLYSLSWLVSMAIAGGDLLEALAGIPYLQGMSLILVICILYTLFGGLYAVIGTDFIQSLIILVGIVFIGGLVVVKLDFSTAYEHIATYQPSLLQIAMPAALLAVFNNMLFGFGEVFHNNVWWSRAFAMRKEIAPKAFFVSGLLWFPIPLEEMRYYFDRLKETVLPNVHNLQNCFRHHGLEVIHVRIQSLTQDGRDRSKGHKRLELHAAPGSGDACFLEEVAPVGDEIIINKTASGVFSSTNLHYVLNNLGISSLYVVGVYTNECVETTVRAACDLGYLVTLVDDCCATQTQELHDASLKTLRNRYARIVNTVEAMEDIEVYVERETSGLA